MDIIRKLKLALVNSGLSEQEIAFYISVLKNPKSTVFDLAKKSKLAKDKAYSIYDSLVNLGLLSYEADGHSKKIIPMPIQNFVDGLYKRGRNFYKIADSLTEVKPFISLLNLPSNTGILESLSGENLAEDWVDLSYVNWENVLGYGDFEMMVEVMGPDADKQFMNRRLKRGKKAYPILSNPGEYTLGLMKKDQRELRQTKIIDSEELKNYYVSMFPDQNLLAIWVKNKNGLVSGVKIENPILTDLHLRTFKYLNEVAKA